MDTVKNAQPSGGTEFRGSDREEKAFAAYMQGSREAPRTEAPPVDWHRVMNAIKAYNDGKPEGAAK